MDSVLEARLPRDLLASLRLIRELLPNYWARAPHWHFTLQGVVQTGFVQRKLEALVAQLPSADYLSPGEIFVALAAVQLYEVGMQALVLPQDLPVSYHLGQALTPQELLVIRAYKPQLSQRLILDSARQGYDGPPLPFGLHGPAREYVPLIAEVCRWCSDDPLEQAPALLPARGEGVRVRLLSALLRLADELYIDPSRVDQTVLARFQLPVAEEARWWAYCCTQTLIENGFIRFHYTLATDQARFLDGLQRTIESGFRYPSNRAIKYLWDEHRLRIQAGNNQATVLWAAGSGPPMPVHIGRYLAPDQQPALADQAPALASHGNGAAGAQPRAAADAALLELIVGPQGRAVTAQLLRTGQPVVTLVHNAPTTIERSALLECAIMQEYGQRLTFQLFADEGLRLAWARATSGPELTAGALRVHIVLDLDTPWLHALHWETLCDPTDAQPLALSERYIFARKLSSSSLARITLPTLRQLKATVAVASPANLEQFGLAEIDIEGEVGRARRALGPHLAQLLGDHPEATGRRAGLKDILGALRHAPHILLLTCHGRQQGEEAYLCLESSRGVIDWVPGDEFSRAVCGLALRPLLVVLAACEGAGEGYGDSLAAVGPRLARAGIPAVLAFQGKVSMGTVRRLLPEFFQEMLRQGSVDSALAVARRHLGEADWWQAVLWLRTTDGRIWNG